eukprot:8451674-Pyramimonas_sp.AAC.1
MLCALCADVDESTLTPRSLAALRRRREVVAERQAAQGSPAQPRTTAPTPQPQESRAELPSRPAQ